MVTLKEYFDRKHKMLTDMWNHMNDTMDVIYDACHDKYDDAVVRSVKAHAKRCIELLEDLEYEFTLYADLLLFMQGFTSTTEEEYKHEGAEGEQDVVQGDE